MRAMKISIRLLLLALTININGCCWFQGAENKSRDPMTVVFRVENTNGNAQAGVRLFFSERGWRQFWPFPEAPMWTVKGAVHEVASDTTGVATVAFHEDFLDLERIALGEHTVTNYMTVYHHPDGHYFKSQHHGYKWTLQYACGPKGEKPWQETYTIVIE